MADENPTPTEDPTPTDPIEPTDPPQEGDPADPEGEDEKFDLERALAKIRKQNSEAENLRKRAKEAEEKAAGSDEKDSRIKALEAENLRIRVGAKHGLPEELIERLRGETEEEILADAEKLLAFVAPTRRPPTDKPTERLRGGTAPTAEPEETDVSKIGERMFRR